MNKKQLITNLGSCALALVVGQAVSAAAPTPAAKVDARRLLAAENESGSWMSYGRTYSEQRYSPLNAINTETVGKLGLAWSYDLNTKRGACRPLTRC